MRGTSASTLLTYGDVPAEYRAANDDALVLDCSDRGLVRVEGADALEFLHRITSCEIHGLSVGQGRAGLLLDSKGKIQCMFDLARTDTEQFELSTPPDQAPGLIKSLDQYIFTEDIQLTDRSAEHNPIELLGSHAGSVLGTVLGEVPEALMHHWEDVESDWGRVRVTHLPVAGSAGWRVDGPGSSIVPIFESLTQNGGFAGGLIARDSLRVEAGVAIWGVDVDSTVYPQEARLEAAFSLTKGCYIGQEVVAKIDTYGGLNKCLMALRVDHDDPVAAGTRLWREVNGEWADLGVITSWTYSFVLDTGLVLAYVRRKHQDVGNKFRIGDGPAQAELVELPLRPGTLTH